jgi:uncharacterized protein (TIGR03083 family)
MTRGDDEPVVGLLAEEWGAIASLGAELAPGEWSLPSECPGWDVKDLLAHVVGTERFLLGEAPPPDPGPAPHVRNPLGAANEAWVAARRSSSGAEVLEEFEQVAARRLERLRAMGPEDFDRVGPSPLGEVPYREFMAARVMDCWVHEQDMRVATGRPGHDGGPVAELALGRLASAMGYVVAKKAAAPEGATVAFELAGDSPRRVQVAVRGGRGVVEDEPVPEPTAVLEMGAEAFWRLACGRVGGEEALGAAMVRLRGDVALGERVVRNMAFMV